MESPARPASKPVPSSVIERLEARIAPATFMVTTTRDGVDGSLRDAIDQANLTAGADQITFAAGVAGKISLTDSLPAITDSVTISAPKGSKLKIDGAEQFQLISIIGPGLDVDISGLGLQGGVAANGGAIYVNNQDGTVTLTKLKIKGNQALGRGDISGYAEGGQGGGVAVVAGTVSISKSKITGNKAGEFQTYGEYVDGEYISRTTFTPSGAGGGISVGSGASLNLENSLVSGNSAGRGGGISNDGDTVVAGSKITKNLASDTYGSEARGGGIANGGGTLEVRDSKVSLNTAKGVKGVASLYGGGMYGGGEYAAASGGSAVGGGISNAAEGTVSIVSSKISGNKALGGKGATGYPGAQGEDAGYYGKRRGDRGGAGGLGGTGGAAAGGGIANDGTLTVESSKVTGNSAIGGAGGKGGTGGRGGQGAAEVAAYAGGNYETAALPPGPGGYGGAGGKGGKGGIGVGGGILDATGTATISKTVVSGNAEINGPLGATGAPGALGKTGKKLSDGGEYYGIDYYDGKGTVSGALVMSGYSRVRDEMRAEVAIIPPADE